MKDNKQMKIFIPEIGTEMVLTKKWTFTLYQEYRNVKLWNKVSDKEFDYHYRDKMESVDVTVPKGTVLILDRIYVRKGKSGYSSLSFKIPKGDKTFGSCRFWAIIEDCNKIECEINDNKKHLNFEWYPPDLINNINRMRVSFKKKIQVLSHKDTEKVHTAEGSVFIQDGRNRSKKSVAKIECTATLIGTTDSLSVLSGTGGWKLKKGTRTITTKCTKTGKEITKQKTWAKAQSVTRQYLRDMYE